ncbi:MAG: hypothetical protein HBSAPP02_20730 [Phycisphaerae bacterium]|nr:MAG: sulfatase-like hydrolase/transferase [Planctomycetia bacterium]RIK69949.1 MAG: hypothetical protein DCC66_06965 [Planctomycetota bacterium]GJQ27041.1 MAG: hypothetical protein HBSAPP02_20730 [Phycisphaerae bacterium]
MSTSPTSIRLRASRLFRFAERPAETFLALLIPFTLLRDLTLPRALVFNPSLRREMIWPAMPAYLLCDALAAAAVTLLLWPLGRLLTPPHRRFRWLALVAQSVLLTTVVFVTAIQYRVWREVGFYPNFETLRRFAGPSSPFLQSARSFTDAATIGELALVLILPSLIAVAARRLPRTATAISLSVCLVATASPLIEVEPPAMALATHPGLRLFKSSSPPADWRDHDVTDEPPSLDSVAGHAPHPPCSLPQLLAAPTHRSIVLVVLESTADQYLFPGGRARFPNLARIARHAIRLTRYYAPSGTSNPAMFNLLTGRHAVPAEEWWDTPRDRAANALPHLLAAVGYESAFFMSGCFRYFFDEPLYRGMGWTRCLDGDDLAREHDIPNALRDPSGHCVDDAVSLLDALHFIDERLEKNTPTFTVLYTGLPHMPYDFLTDSPHALHRGEGLTAFQRYENQLAYVDALIGRLHEHLIERRFFERGLLILTADHGEAFGQHAGNYVHGAHLFDENTRVPLLIAHPALTEQPCDTPASHIDFAPTLLQLTGVETSARMDGRSIFADERSAMIFLSAAHNELKLGAIDWPYKAIHLLAADRTMLFNLADDPDESRDLAAAQPELARRYRRWIKSFRYHYLTPDRLKNLPPAEQHYWNGRQAMATGASPSLAVGCFREALALRPDYTEARLALAECYYRLGEHCLRSKRPDEAALQFSEALRLNPEHKEARAALETLQAE